MYNWQEHDNSEETDLLQYAKGAIKSSNLHKSMKFILNNLVERATLKKPIYKYKSKRNRVVVIAQPYCPFCDKNVFRNTDENFCDKCGQALDWSDE
jgi:hypothetical protein